MHSIHPCVSSLIDSAPNGAEIKEKRMFRAITVATLVCASFVSLSAAEARVCRNSHGKHFHCHKVVAPRVNLKARHPVKLQRCRGHVGKFNNC